uniref:Uncharacterized protein n=1 Tax=Parascaris univalens TaxID=6257 RepID=A0A915BJY8_PARUN
GDTIQMETCHLHFLHQLLQNVHNILCGFLIILPLFPLVLLLNVITECIRKRTQMHGEQSRLPQKSKARRFKQKMLVEPSIRISLQSPIDSAASGTLDNYGVDSAGFSQPNKDLVNVSSTKIARAVPGKLKYSESSEKHDRKTHTSLTQKSSTTSQEAKKSKNKITVKETDEATAPKCITQGIRNEKEKVPTLDEVLRIGKLKNTSKKRMLNADGRPEKAIEQLNWEEICVPQTARKLNVNKSPLMPNTDKCKPLVTKEMYKEDETEKTEGTLVSDRTQQFSEERGLLIVEHPNNVVMSSDANKTISQTEVAVEDDREKATVTSTKTDSSDRATRTEAASVESLMSTTKKGTSSSRKDETGAKSSDASRLSSRESTETTRTIATNRRHGHKESSDSQDLVDLENTQSSHRLIQRQPTGNFKLEQFDKSKTQLQKSRSENIPTARGRQCRLRRQRKTSSVGDTQTTQRSQLENSTSTLRRGLAERVSQNARKFNSTDSTEEDSRSRKARLRPRRNPIKVHPDRLRIPCKRGAQNPPAKLPTNSKGMQE